MSDPVADVFESLMARLRADAGVQAKVGMPARVFDAQPVNSTMPFVVVGVNDVRDAGTKDVAALSLALSVTVVHRERTLAEARAILAAVRACLHNADVERVVRCQEEYTSLASGKDGQRVVARYRVIVS